MANGGVMGTFGQEPMADMDTSRTLGRELVADVASGIETRVEQAFDEGTSPSRAPPPPFADLLW